MLSLGAAVALSTAALAGSPPKTRVPLCYVGGTVEAVSARDGRRVLGRVSARYHPEGHNDKPASLTLKLVSLRKQGRGPGYSGVNGHSSRRVLPVGVDGTIRTKAGTGVPITDNHLVWFDELSAEFSQRGRRLTGTFESPQLRGGRFEVEAVECG